MAEPISSKNLERRYQVSRSCISRALFQIVLQGLATREPPLASSKTKAHTSSRILLGLRTVASGGYSDGLPPSLQNQAGTDV